MPEGYLHCVGSVPGRSSEPHGTFISGGEFMRNVGRGINQGRRRGRRLPRREIPQCQQPVRSAFLPQLTTQFIIQGPDLLKL